MLRQPRPGWVLTGRGRPGSGTQSRTRALGIPRRGWPPLGRLVLGDASQPSCGNGAGMREFPRPQPHSLIVCDSLIVCAPAFSSPVGVEPLQRRYKPLQSCYESLRSRYESLHSRYGAVTNLASRYGVGRLKKACALQRHSLRSQPSSDGLAPWVVPSAPLPQGDSPW